MTEYHIPVRLESITNKREHWSQRHRRAKKHREATAAIVPKGGHTLPCVVTITRVGKRRMDDDNLASSAKSVRDQVAQQLGADDGDPRIEWRYAQERGEYGANVKIERQKHEQQRKPAVRAGVAKNPRAHIAGQSY